MSKCNHSKFDYDVVKGKKVIVKTGHLSQVCHCENCGKIVKKGKKTNNKAFGKQYLSSVVL